jgi:hypothetical protein
MVPNVSYRTPFVATIREVLLTHRSVFGAGLGLGCLTMLGMCVKGL